jgi:hypothetical protein
VRSGDSANELVLSDGVRPLALAATALQLRAWPEVSARGCSLPALAGLGARPRFAVTGEPTICGVTDDAESRSGLQPGRLF